MTAYVPVRSTEMLPENSGEFLTDLGRLWFDTDTRVFKTSPQGAIVPDYALRYWYRSVYITEYSLTPEVMRKAEPI
jgi:hypothetical protein